MQISDELITQKELASIFTDGVPIPVMKMIFPEKSEKLTVEDIRYILNAMRSEAALSTDAEPVKTAPAVAVKALEWQKDAGKPDDLYVVAKSIVGSYRISPIGREGFELRLLFADQFPIYASIAEAKAAAQADYEARIRSALSAQVQDTPTALDALQAIANLPTGDNLDVCQGQEEAYRAVGALFSEAPYISAQVQDVAGNAELLRMVDIAENRLIAIHKALHPEMHGITGIESPQDHVAYMVSVLQAAYDGVTAPPASKHGDAK